MERYLSKINIPNAVIAACILVSAATVLLGIVFQTIYPLDQVSDPILFKMWFSDFAIVVIVLLLIFGMLQSDLSQKVFVFLIPIVSILSFAWMKYSVGVSNEFYRKIVYEDHLIEVLGAIAFFLAAFVSAGNTIRLHRLDNRLAMIFHAGLTLFILWLALEEISYGQRILGFRGPDFVVEANIQEEFNAHNIGSLSYYMDEVGPALIIYWGLFSWILVHGAPRFLSRDTSWGALFRIIGPPWYLSSFFLPYAIWAYVDVCCDDREVLIWQDQEPAESYLALAYLVTVVSIHVMTRRWETESVAVARNPVTERSVHDVASLGR